MPLTYTRTFKSWRTIPRRPKMTLTGVELAYENLQSAPERNHDIRVLTDWTLLQHCWLLTLHWPAGIVAVEPGYGQNEFQPHGTSEQITTAVTVTVTVLEVRMS